MGGGGRGECVCVCVCVCVRVCVLQTTFAHSSRNTKDSLYRKYITIGTFSVVSNDEFPVSFPISQYATCLFVVHLTVIPAAGGIWIQLNHGIIRRDTEHDITNQSVLVRNTRDST